jgi:hypothetical protein
MSNNNNYDSDNEMTVVTGSDTVHPPVQCLWKNSTIKLSFQWQEAMPASGLVVKATTNLDVMQKSFQQDMKLHDNHDNGLHDYTLPDAAKFTTMYSITSVKGNTKKKEN